MEATATLLPFISANGLSYLWGYAYNISTAAHLESRGPLTTGGQRNERGRSRPRSEHRGRCRLQASIAGVLTLNTSFMRFPCKPWQRFHKFIILSRTCTRSSPLAAKTTIVAPLLPKISSIPPPQYLLPLFLFSQIRNIGSVVPPNHRVIISIQCIFLPFWTRKKEK